MSNSDYLKFRGKCKELSEEFIKQNKDYVLIRGHYDCPIWGLQTHWWTKDSAGNIFDPSKKQFPSKGIGEYIEFDGICECSECGKKGAEETFTFASNYQFCSYECYGKFVGVL